MVQHVICVKVYVFESYFYWLRKKKISTIFGQSFESPALCGGERKIRGSDKGRPLLLTFPGREKEKGMT